MKLMERDLLLISSLLKYGTLSTGQIDKLLFNRSHQVLMRRLTKLEKDSYIQRKFWGRGTEHIWYLTDKGASLVADRAPRRNISRYTLEHDLLLVNLRLCLEGLGIAKHWIPEHEIKSKIATKHGLESLKRRTVPDGIIGVEIDGFKQSIAVELELHSKNSKRYRRIFTDYQMKDNLHAVWYLVPNKLLAHHLEKLWYKTEYGGLRVQFYWSLVDDVIANGAKAKIVCSKREQTLNDLFLKNQEVLPDVSPDEWLIRGAIEKTENKSVISAQNQTAKIEKAS